MGVVQYVTLLFEVVDDHFLCPWFVLQSGGDVYCCRWKILLPIFLEIFAVLFDEFYRFVEDLFAETEFSAKVL